MLVQRWISVGIFSCSDVVPWSFYNTVPTLDYCWHFLAVATLYHGHYPTLCQHCLIVGIFRWADVVSWPLLNVGPTSDYCWHFELWLRCTMVTSQRWPNIGTLLAVRGDVVSLPLPNVNWSNISADEMLCHGHSITLGQHWIIVGILSRGDVA